MDLQAAMRLHAEGRLADAERGYRGLLAAGDLRPDVLHWLGMVLYQTGRAREALPFVQRSVELSPSIPEFNANLGCVLSALGRTREAVRYSRRATALAPSLAMAHYDLAAVLEALGDASEALKEHDLAIALDPTYAPAHTGRGNVLRNLGRAEEALASYRKATALRPDSPDAYRNLAPMLCDLGDVPGAIECYQRLVELRPNDAGYHSAILVMMHYSDHFSPQELFAEARRWATRHAEPLTAQARVEPPERVSGERLRIGYVSGDFRDHPVGRYADAIVSAHDRARVCVFCYSDVKQPDGITSRLRDRAENWRDVAGLSDEQLAQRIRADGIHVLVDLAGHFANNRLLVFARRAAPVQVTHFGYCDTTGMSAMDWHITDPVSNPPREPEQCRTERLYRMPSVAWPYHPVDEAPDPGPLPALANGYVTFCCLNNPTKITECAIALWSKILAQLSSARLMLLSKGGENSHVIRRFGVHGVAADRLRFAPVVPRHEYLALYRQADIGLDTFPYNGDNTTCDALWMGVPVLTFAGHTFASRRSASHLFAVGLSDFIVHAGIDLVGKALAVAGNLNRLVHIRSTLREMLKTSPLGDLAVFTRNLEEAYGYMWKNRLFNNETQ